MHKDIIFNSYISFAKMMHLITLVLLLVLRVDSFMATDTSVDDGSCNDSTDTSPLEQARNLHPPIPKSTKYAEYEDAEFWNEHGQLIRDAWEEWENSIDITNYDDHINPTLSEALDNTFERPTKETESQVKYLWKAKSDDDESLLPKGVYSIQLFTPSGISHIRNLLDLASISKIPTRRPNGMNRNGFIIDSNVNGAVSVKSLVQLVEEEIINRVARPVGRMLYPDRIGCDDDIEYFAFTIRYDGSDDEDQDGDVTNNKDFELREHRDASIVTLNINLNLPDEGYDGSEVYFRGYPTEEWAGDESDKDDEGGTVRFSPGKAIIHLGAHRHGSLPIIATSNSKTGSSGKRYNLVIWLFGRDGDVRIASYKKEEQMNVEQRWLGCNQTKGDDIFG